MIVHGVLVDFYWPQFRLVVEVDSWRFHRGRRSFEDDRRRDIGLTRHGTRTARITTTRIRHEPGPLITDVVLLMKARV